MTDPQASDYAGFWQRLLAQGLDTVLFSCVWLPAIASAYGLEAYFSDPRLVRGMADLVLSWLLPAVLVLAFWLLACATPGKWLVGARIVDAESGDRPSPAQLVIRWAGYLPAVLPFGAGLFWVAFDARKRGWHDKLAGTVVVRRCTR